MKQPNEKLMTIALEILKVNPTASLSGSLALHIQGIDTRREAHDIDIYLPIGQKLISIDGLKDDIFANMDDDYDNDEYERIPLVFNDVSVDVFKPIDTHIQPLITDSFFYGANYIKCVRQDEIIRMKVNHALSESESRYKHKDDVIHILINN